MSQPEQKPISPGPWKAIGDQSSRWNIWSGDNPVALGGPYYGSIHNEANAHLIAAAPDQHEALKELTEALAELEGVEIPYRTAKRLSAAGLRAQAVIAKAEGRE